MPEQVRISAIIPIYNGQEYLREAVESVIAQTLPPIELILVDDGSTDDSLRTVADLKPPFPIRVITQRNAGQSAARNHGVRVSEGNYIALLDQDDAWYPEHLEELCKPFLSEKRLGWVYSNLDVKDGNERVTTFGLLNYTKAKHPKGNLEELVGEDMHILPSASLILKEAFLAVGGFDERLSGYEDDDLFRRMFEAGWRHIYLPESLSFWRIYGGSTSYSPRMVASRNIYARKLWDEYLDIPSLGRYWRTELIGPRFFRIALNEYIKSIKNKDYSACRKTLKEVIAYYKMLPRHARVKWLPVVLLSVFPHLFSFTLFIARLFPKRIFKGAIA